MPASGVTGAGEAFVKNIEFEKPMPVQGTTIRINVRCHSVAPLDDGCTFTEISRVDVALVVSGLAITLNVELATIGNSDHAASLLPIADPIKVRVIDALAIWLNV